MSSSYIASKGLFASIVNSYIYDSLKIDLIVVEQSYHWL